MWTTTDALAQARQLLNLSPSDGGNVWRVRRLDSDGAYFLVHVADHVACLDSATGELLTSAVAERTPVAVTHEVAVERAALGGTPTVELVWAPCAATMSMFDPLWSVTRDRQCVFLDQRAKVWHTLPAKVPGGAAVFFGSIRETASGCKGPTAGV